MARVALGDIFTGPPWAICASPVGALPGFGHDGHDVDAAGGPGLLAPQQGEQPLNFARFEDTYDLGVPGYSAEGVFSGDLDLDSVDVSPTGGGQRK